MSSRSTYLYGRALSAIPFVPGSYSLKPVHRVRHRFVWQCKPWSKAYVGEHELLISSLTHLDNDDVFVYLLLPTSNGLVLLGAFSFCGRISAASRLLGFDVEGCLF